MTTTRRIIALVCILAVVVAGVTSSASDLQAIVLAPLDLLFGIVVTAPVPDTDDVRLASAPLLSVRGPRAPPAA